MRFEDIPDEKCYEGICKLEDILEYSVEEYLEFLQVDEDCKMELIEGTLAVCKYGAAELNETFKKLTRYLAEKGN